MTYLNFRDATPDQSLYRITSVERFVEDLRSRENVLVRPSKWEDPFEAIILNSYGILPDGAQVMFRLRHNYFGQCWSLHKETDLMWRAYSPEARGVKLRIRADKLHDSLADHHPTHGLFQSFLGRVRYQQTDEFRETLQRGCDFGRPGESQAQTLLLKRFGFRSEREVRLIAYAEVQADVLRYPVDWNDLVLEAVLDPGMPEADAIQAGKEILAAGYQGRLYQSGLYRAPRRNEFKVRLDGAPRAQ